MKREDFLLVLASSVGGIVWGANTVIMALYLKSLGLNPLTIGVILGSAIIVNTLLSLFWAVLGDAYGRKKFVYISRGVGGLSFLLLLITPYAYLFTNQGYGLISSILAEKSGDLDKAMAYRSSLNTIFSVVGSLLPIALNYRSIIALDSIVTFLSLLLLIPVKENYKGTRKVTLKISSFKVLGKLSTEAIIGLGAGVLLPMLSLWFNLRFHATASSLSPIYAISEITLALGTLTSPFLAKTLGRIKAIVITHFAAIALLFIMPFSTSLFIAGVIYVMRNVLMNSTGPLMNSLVFKVVKEEERSRVNSMLQLLDAIPRSLGPNLTGYLFYIGNLNMPFFITGSLYLVATILFYNFFKDIKI
ncbi:MFS transporter [Saccharolobus shibatae]|uniref:Putative MFS-type transporter n=1 Tax=Saccharolobus shibatae TaxID=2286 RepID=A0A8F5BT19_9CREN|nr:MFS transporter [Saccharolobus shibatae]QXJ30788.1 putative MFS-type transporter [Saccharolobus shibatae]QXJ33813.1 putative MFS-type transporter [Saccharolobus shibatae]